MARIRVVVAEAPIRNLVRAMLDLEGYDVVAAANASAGLQQSQAARTDLALRDIAYCVAL